MALGAQLSVVVPDGVGRRARLRSRASLMVGSRGALVVPSVAERFRSVGQELRSLGRGAVSQDLKTGGGSGGCPDRHTCVGGDLMPLPLPRSSIMDELGASEAQIAAGAGPVKAVHCGTAYGGACRPGLDRTRPLRRESTHVGRESPADLRRPRGMRRQANRITGLSEKITPPEVRSAAARVLGRARRVLEQRTFSPLIDAKAAGRMLGVPHTWLLAQARAGRIPHHRLGHYVRFDVDDLQVWLHQTRSGPPLENSSRRRDR